MAGLTSVGFNAKTLDQIHQAIVDGVHSGISGEMDLSSKSPWGQLIGIFASELSEAWEGAQANYTDKDIDQATGDSLTALCKLNGVRRLAATPSVALLTITLTPGTYTAGTLVVNTVGDAAARFTNDATIVVASTTTYTGVPFTADTTGPLRAEPNTLTVITNPVIGFSAPTNPAEATLGRDIEQDNPLRIRYYQQLARVGSASVDAMRADILQAVGVTFASVFENDGDVTDSAGRPPHSTEFVLLGGVDAAVGTAVFRAKPGGIKAYGTTNVAVVDSQGNPHSVGFTRPTNTTVYMKFTASVLANFAGRQVLLNVLTDWADQNLSVGTDVLIARFVSLAMGVPGMVNIELEVGLSSGATAPTDLVIGPRAIAILDQTNIATTINVVSAAP